MGWFTRKEDVKGTKEWFDELLNAFSLYAMAMREEAHKGNTYIIMSKNIPGYMSLIDSLVESKEVTKEMKRKVYESSDSEFSKIIHYSKNNGAPKREVEFFENTIKEIKEKLS